MMSEGTLIKTGFKLPAGGGEECIIESFLGGGGQGEVYKVRIGTEHYALKWYFSQNQKEELKKSLKDLVKIGSPSSNFLWPKQVIEYKGAFGYLMALRPLEYKKSQKLLDREFSLSYSTAANACLQLVDSFRKLHVKGLSYQDISWGNLFIEPITGNVLICDNDNVAPHGSNVVGISGTYGFMAPEVVRGERKPDQYTDLFSLAALMFQMLFLEHPFNGRRWANIACWDDFAKKKLYGTEPIFIFDPHNDANRPEPGVQDNAAIFWEMYPNYVKKMFVKVFTTGLHDRENGRILEEEWIEVFRTLKQTIFPCPVCGSEVIFDHQLKEKTGEIPCWRAKYQKCQKNLPLPPRLKITLGKRERYVVLNHDTKLKSYQLISREDDVKKGDIPVGEMTQSPKDPTKWGIKNLTNSIWSYTNTTGETKDVAPGKAFVLTKGIKIDFKTAQGEVI